MKTRHRFHLGAVLDLFRGIKLAMLPPLMVYFAAGVSGFTGIIESFFIKDVLTLTAVGLASLGFWAGLPWALKMPIGHMVDLHWSHKSVFVYIGAGIMALSLLIMVGLTGHLSWMAQWTTPDIWYIISVLLSPIGYVLQDVVADAMTVDAVPTEGTPAELQSAHVTMQTLGRVAIVGGGVLVAGAGGWLAEVWSYHTMYLIALVIPVISVLGVIISRKRKHEECVKKATLDKRIIFGSILFVLVSLGFGLTGWKFKEEAVLLGSLGIILYLVHCLLKDLPDEKRREIWGIAFIIFVFRATPGFGAGMYWWEIDTLGFDESFFGTLRQVGGFLAIGGMFALRSWMARRPVPYLVVFLSVYSAFMMLPYIGMFYGLHLWTQAHLGFGAQTIAMIDTVATDPIGQVAMIPMLAWIAKEAPRHQKAIYFATMAAFSNLALSTSAIGTKYLNQVWIVERGAYQELGVLMIVATVIGLALPVGAVAVVQWRKK